MVQNRTPDGWEADNGLYGKRSEAECPPCVNCGQPMWYMITLFGLAKMHEGTDGFLCSENEVKT